MCSSHLFTREAVNVIKSWTRGSPGFMHLSYTAPHDPLQAPGKHLDMPDCKSMLNWRRRTFCGMVKVIDEGAADIKRALEETGHADNTIILFATDNGGAFPLWSFNHPPCSHRLNLRVTRLSCTRSANLEKVSKKRPPCSRGVFTVPRSCTSHRRLLCALATTCTTV